MRGNFLERQAVAAVQDERRHGAGRKFGQRSLEQLDALLGFGLHRRVLRRQRLHVRKYVENIERLGALGAAQTMLIKNVVCQGEYVRLGHPDRFMVPDPDEAQENLLDEISSVRGVTHACQKEASEPLAVLGGNGNDECLFLLGVQRLCLSRAHGCPVLGCSTRETGYPQRTAAAS